MKDLKLEEKAFTNEIESKRVDKVETSSLIVIDPHERRIWLRKIGEELEEWVSCEDDVMSHKPIREAWAEAVKIKRTLEKEIAASCSQLVSSQEAILEKQDVAAEKVQRLTDIVQDIKDHLQKKREKKGETKPLRDEIKYSLYQELMKAPSPRYTRHAHAERARKRIVFTLLYYTWARVNELRNITYHDLMGVIQEGRVKLALHKQKDAIVRVLATEGQEEMRKLTPEVEFLFSEQKSKFLGESYKKRGEVMHEKAWIFYINKEIKKAKEALKMNDVLSSHSFRVGFVTRHLKHADSHVVSKIVGHKNIATTLKYNRYVMDEDKVREILDKGY